MERLLEKSLIEWRKLTDRLPIILRGARQVGKSYLVEQFGRQYFSTLVVVNFEFQPTLKACFESLDPIKIIQSLELLTRQTIRPGECLLFLDEIQECPNAVMALRYFKEKMPDLHVIGAGSLLEFVLEEERFSFPVGRVQFLYLKPLSFHEFLLSLGEFRIVEFLEQTSLGNPPTEAIHEYCIKIFKQYLLIGGMPAAVNAYLQHRSFLASQRMHQVLLQTYQSDFGKYATRTQHKYLQTFFERAPGLVSRHFKYVEVDPDARSRDLRVALRQLSWAGILHCIYETDASGIPLQAQIDERKFKLLFLDVGLLQSAGKTDAQMIWDQDLIQVHNGMLAEQVVGQELISYQDSFEVPSLYFWKRDKRNSEAEVDYVIQVGSKVIPIEVKSGKYGHLKSLQRFMEEKKCPLGVKISSSPLSQEKNVLSVPFYLIEHLSRFLE